MNKEILLDVQHLSHTFTKPNIKHVLNDVSFSIYTGEVFSIVGESGSGKSTLAKIIMNILQPTRGKVFYQGIDITNKKQYKQYQKQFSKTRQIIFQDSSSSLDPHMKVVDIISEPMQIHHIKPTRKTYRKEAAFQMHYVGLDASCLDQYPTQLSGGMRQRVAIARALTMEPNLLVADEPIASLDVSIQAQIMNLFKHLQKEHGFTFLLIAHDLSMVRFLSDRVAIMYQGKIVEMGKTELIYTNPQHPYTKALLQAMPIPDPKIERSRTIDMLQTYSVQGTLQKVEDDHVVLL